MKININVKLYVDVCTYKVVNKQMKDYLDKIFLKTMYYKYYIKIELISVTEGKKVKGNSGKKSIVCHYCFYNRGFSFQNSVCNGCHNLKKLSFNISDITIKNVDYHCIIHKLANLKQFIY